MSDMQSQLTQLLEPVVESLGCELWGIEYRISGKKAHLIIYIDKDESVGIDDCERVSRQASSVLDVEDLIANEYTLEVSSPGMDRSLYKLDHYVTLAGMQIKIKLRVAYEGRKNFSGLLKGVEGDEVVLEVDKEEYLLPFELIDKSKVVPSY